MERTDSIRPRSAWLLVGACVWLIFLLGTLAGRPLPVAAEEEKQAGPRPEAEALTRALKPLVDSVLVDSLSGGRAIRLQLGGANVDSLRRLPRIVPRPGGDVRVRPVPRGRELRHSVSIDIEEVRADSSFVLFRGHLRSGNLAAARAALADVIDQSRHPIEREVAEFDQIELDFFAAEFDSALAGYRHFAVTHPRGYLTNDAIARIFLIDDNSDVGRKPLALYARAQLELRAGRQDSAIAILHKAIERYAGSGLEDDLLLALGDAILDTEPAAALASYRRVADSIPDSELAAAALMRIGSYHVKIERDFNKGMEVYEQVLERFPGSLEADEARKRIESLRQRT
jgi:tetratricopeptide (TPR) repeat protein